MVIYIYQKWGRHFKAYLGTTKTRKEGKKKKKKEAKKSKRRKKKEVKKVVLKYYFHDLSQLQQACQH